MLRKARSLKGYTLDCQDGEIGKVDEFYFDDRRWSIRYVTVETGSWLTGRQVLISPHALGGTNLEARRLAVHLTRKQIEDSPPLESDKPVSRQFEEGYHGYYGWPTYWYGPTLWGEATFPAAAGAPPKDHTREDEDWDPHLRSTRDVTGHHVQAKDGEIGHVEDFVIDDATWRVCYLIVDTRNWWPGKKVLVSPRWIESVSWIESKVTFDLDRESILHAPEYTDETQLTRDYETGLYRHYHRAGYWTEAPVAQEHSR